MQRLQKAPNHPLLVSQLTLTLTYHSLFIETN